MSIHVAETILRQLGGRRFIAMTGAKHFLTLSAPEQGVTFKLPLKGKGPNYWKIRLTAADDYTIETFYGRGLNLTPLQTFTGIYCDQLVEVFERETGLVTKL